MLKVKYSLSFSQLKYEIPLTTSNPLYPSNTNFTRKLNKNEKVSVYTLCVRMVSLVFNFNWLTVIKLYDSKAFFNDFLIFHSAQEINLFTIFFW